MSSGNIYYCNEWVWEKLNFDGVYFNDGYGYIVEGPTYQFFLAPVDGVYHFSYNLEVFADSSPVFIGYQIPGFQTESGPVKYLDFAYAKYEKGKLVGDFIVQLKTGDKLRLVYTGGGIAATIGGTFNQWSNSGTDVDVKSTFSGYLVYQK